jgi:hypothetical protein
MHAGGIRATSVALSAAPKSEGGRTMRLPSFFAFILIAALAAPGFAQAPPSASPTRVRGTVAKFDGHMLTVKSRDGGSVAVTLAPDFTVRAVVAKTIADIKPGDKVGVTSVKGADGTRRALEIHIFPASMTTVRMGEFPWDLGPDSLMTNAPVAQVSAAPQARMIKVTLNGKESEITVPPDTPIVSFAAGDPSLLTPGAAVFLLARKQADGSLAGVGVTVEKNGAKPPM